MTSELTTEEEGKIRDFFKDRHIPQGLGTEEEVCSLAGINLALTGCLTDAIPDCMSLVLGRWIICIQDSMPDGMRNGNDWRDALPYAAGTGRSHEKEIAALIMNWMWTTVLPQLQPQADKRGYGEQWMLMCELKTYAAARTAQKAAAATAAYAADAADAAAYAAAYAAYAAADAAYAAAYAAADAAYAAADAAATAAYAAADAAYAAADAAYARATFWTAVNPPALLNEIVALVRGAK